MSLNKSWLKGLLSRVIARWKAIHPIVSLSQVSLSPSADVVQTKQNVISLPEREINLVKLKKDEKYGLGKCVLFLKALSKWK